MGLISEVFVDGRVPFCWSCLPLVGSPSFQQAERHLFGAVETIVRPLPDNLAPEADLRMPSGIHETASVGALRRARYSHASFIRLGSRQRPPTGFPYYVQVLDRALASAPARIEYAARHKRH